MNPRDPTDPKTLFLPAQQRDAAKRLEFKDFEGAQAIISELLTLQSQCGSDLQDAMTAHYSRFAALESNLRTALHLEPNQTIQYAESYALMLHGTPLTGAALEAAKELHQARTGLRLMALATQLQQERVSAAADKLEPLMSAATQAAGLEVGKVALLYEHLVPFNPLAPNAPTKLGVKA